MSETGAPPTTDRVQAPLLRVEGLVRHFEAGAVRALDGIDFEACSGETVALTGPSGCGKSTLLSLIGLLDRPTAGRMVVAGVDLARIRDVWSFRARQVGFVFQFHHMVPTMTLQENVEAPMVALGVPRRERAARAAAMLAEVDLAARSDFLPSRVSGGERQRAAVARALVNRPRIVLADEPTGNLDTVNGQRVVDLLVAQARQRGALVLLATHNPEIAAAMDRRIALRDGRLVAPDDPARARGATGADADADAVAGADSAGRPGTPLDLQPASAWACSSAMWRSAFSKVSGGWPPVIT